MDLHLLDPELACYSLLAFLNNGLLLSPLKCPMCAFPHMDQGKSAMVPLVIHECQGCKYIFQIACE